MSFDSFIGYLEKNYGPLKGAKGGFDKQTSSLLLRRKLRDESDFLSSKENLPKMTRNLPRLLGRDQQSTIFSWNSISFPNAKQPQEQHSLTHTDKESEIKNLLQCTEFCLSHFRRNHLPRSKRKSSQLLSIKRRWKVVSASITSVHMLTVVVSGVNLPWEPEVF